MLKGYTISNTVSSILPLGPQSLKYLLSGPLQEKYAVPCLHCHDTFCHTEPPKAPLLHSTVPLLKLFLLPEITSLPQLLDSFHVPGAWNTEQISSYLLGAHSFVRKTCSYSSESRTVW